MKIKLSSYLFILPALLIISCGGETTVEDKDKNRIDSLPPNDSGTASTTKDFFYSLPSPIAMAAVFKSAGVKYNEALVNPPDKVSKYNSQRSMALNMGVYNADMAYTLMSEQTQLALK